MTKKTVIKRQKEIKIRLTEEEHQALLERMEGRNWRHGLETHA